ncbi:acyltransferase family protein [Dyella sp. 20L07]|uniref:acyltransferase family protein n=1 Tax=Dyella sp. 20L07 TaxID=3384240 RepID=UPI003D2D2D7D
MHRNHSAHPLDVYRETNYLVFPWGVRAHSAGCAARCGQINHHRNLMSINRPNVNAAVDGAVGTKDHYLILDGLRGVAALVVVLFHICEAYSPDHPLTQVINHGYLAVDFFFLLSGFVVAYAYDDRWSSMSISGFFKRRLIRLQPMVIMGMTLGALLFYFQAGATFPLIQSTPIWQVIVVMLVGYTLLPLPPSLDIRGWGEMHPLNGPAWSLFFEYVANILYAVGLRKVSNRVLVILAGFAALFLMQLAVFGKRGDLIGGWSLEPEQLHIGFARLLFPFLAGMLLMRLGKRLHVKHAFMVSGALLVIALAVPRLGGADHLWINGLYESLCIIVIFPLVVAIGAGGSLHKPVGRRVATWLGDISYPLYITHYGLIYIYTQWISKHDASPLVSKGVGALVFVGTVAIAFVCLKYYDEPVRKWLQSKANSARKDGRHEIARAGDQPTLDA